MKCGRCGHNKGDHWLIVNGRWTNPCSCKIYKCDCKQYLSSGKCEDCGQIESTHVNSSCFHPDGTFLSEVKNKCKRFREVNQRSKE